LFYENSQNYTPKTAENQGLPKYKIYKTNSPRLKKIETSKSKKRKNRRIKESKVTNHTLKTSGSRSLPYPNLGEEKKYSINGEKLKKKRNLKEERCVHKHGITEQKAHHNRFR